MARRNFPGRLTVVLNRARQSDTSACVYIRREIRSSSDRYIKKLNDVKTDVSIGKDGSCRMTTWRDSRGPEMFVVSRTREDIVFNNALILLQLLS